MDDAPGYPLGGEFLVEPLADHPEIGAEQITSLWVSEGALDQAHADERVNEVCMVGLTSDGELAGVSTSYLHRDPQLQLELWFIRAFVGEAHRRSVNLATNLLWFTRNHHRDRFVSGEDQRAIGAGIEVENEDLKKFLNQAHWMPTDFTFYGESELGAHMRVHWFPGAKLPARGSASA